MVKKLSELKEASGTKSIVFVNESCLWGEKTKEALLLVFSEIAKADFVRAADLFGLRRERSGNS